MTLRILSILRKLNRAVAIGVGLLFFACAGLVLVDIVLRRFGSSLGGTDEISGYVMAICTAWGMAYTMLELAHVRIDFIRALAPTKVRALFDVVAMFAMAMTVLVIALYCWPVVETTLKNGSRANTPLETPLILVQLPWFIGWAWYALMAWLVFVVSLLMIVRGEFAASEKTIGVFTQAGQSN